MKLRDIYEQSKSVVDMTIDELKVKLADLRARQEELEAAIDSTDDIGEQQRLDDELYKVTKEYKLTQGLAVGAKQAADARKIHQEIVWPMKKSAWDEERRKSKERLAASRGETESIGEAAAPIDIDSKLKKLRANKAEILDFILGQRKKLYNTTGEAKNTLTARIDQATAMLTAVKQDIERLEGIRQQKDIGSATDEILTAYANETPEEKSARLSRAMSDGHRAGRRIRDESQGWGGLAADVHKYVVDATNHGADRITTADIAARYPDVTPRTVDKWLERPEFLKTARLMGRR